MKIVNSVQISGNLTTDAKYFSGARPNGELYHITQFDIAHTHPVAKGANPQVYFFKCVAFKDIALALKDFKRGDEIMVSKGFLKYTTYERKSGGKAYLTQIVIQDFDRGFVEAKREESLDEPTDPTSLKAAIKDSGLEGLDDFVF